MSDFLSGNADSVKFEKIGDKITGTLVSISDRDDTDPNGAVKKWPDGAAKKVYLWELVIDDEPRTMWVRGNLVKVLREACAAAGAKGIGDLIGCKVQVIHHALGEAKSKGFAPPKLFQAKVTLLTPEEREATTKAVQDDDPECDPFAE